MPIFRGEEQLTQLALALTIEDKTGKKLAVIESKTRKLLWSSDNLVKDLALKVLATKPRLREEYFDHKNDKITMYLREVDDDDSFFSEAMRQEFERQGYFAQLVSFKAAQLQVLLRASSLDRELQDKIVYRLPKMTEDQVRGLLEDTQKE